MKKKLQASLLCLISISAMSQVTINGSDVNPSVGNSITDNSTTYASPGNAGANQTWDFSTLTSGGTSSTTITASTTNGANMKFSTSSADAHYSVTSSEQEIKEIFASSTTITYSNGEKVLQFPLAYNASYSDTFRATFMSGGIYPAVRAGSNTLLVDGYGTLMLPSQTISDVVRVRLQQDYADTIDIGTPYIINYTSDIYIWYKAGFKSPVLSMTTFDGGGTVSSYGAYTNAVDVGIDKIEGVEELKILGNPFTENLKFSIQTTSELPIDYQIVDISGSVIYASNSATLLNGENVLTIPTTELSTGVYALKITSGSSTISKLIIRE